MKIPALNDINKPKSSTFISGSRQGSNPVDKKKTVKQCVEQCYPGLDIKQSCGVLIAEVE